MELWPAIDLRGGYCVRLQQGDYGRETVFGEDPVETVKQFTSAGSRRLHIVDLEGAKDGAAIQSDLIRQMVAAAGVPCQVGGGVRSREIVESYLEAGVSRLVMGSVAIEQPDLFAELAHRRLSAPPEAGRGKSMPASLDPVQAFKAYPSHPSQSSSGNESVSELMDSLPRSLCEARAPMWRLLDESVPADLKGDLYGDLLRKHSCFS